MTSIFKVNFYKIYILYRSQINNSVSDVSKSTITSNAFAKIFTVFNFCK